LRIASSNTLPGCRTPARRRLDEPGRDPVPEPAGADRLAAVVEVVHRLELPVPIRYRGSRSCGRSRHHTSGSAADSRGPSGRLRPHGPARSRTTARPVST
jgi:hypothetical protein